ncbi:cyclic nucleotide-binding domain-containing protein 2-like [Clytia hemisphaerica]|uniref:cyclic nucleotide-binding domain-containing protein 2-like n=1 Tax=Clytia hemisphaerica TaxID=252671 RepID=UPI0034D78647
MQEAYQRQILDIDYEESIDANQEIELSPLNYQQPPVAKKKTRDFILRKEETVYQRLQIKPSQLSRNLEQELKTRENEIRRFVEESQNAIISPLLTQALVKKTERFLNSNTSFECHAFSQSSLHKFRRKVKVVCIICRIPRYWKLYDNKLLMQIGVGRPEDRQQNILPPIRSKKNNPSINFDTRNFSVLNKLSDDVKECLKVHPERRSDLDKKKITLILSKYKVFQMFSRDKHDGLAKMVGYESYDPGRVICLQNRTSDRFYFILSGLVSKVKTLHLAEGVRKRYLQELSHGFYTDLNETLQTNKRQYSLVCKTDVEVFLLEREHLQTIFFTQETQLSKQLLLESIDLFKTYPIEQLVNAIESTRVEFYAKSDVIERNIHDSPFIYIVKAGSCSVYMRRSDIPSISLNSTEDSKKTLNNSQTNHFLRRLPHLTIKNDLRHQDYVVVSTIHHKDIYGLDSLLPRVRNMVRTIISDSADSYPKALATEKTILVSNGAECLLINKNKLMRYADFCTISKLMSLERNSYAPTLEKLHAKIRWDAYKTSMVDKLKE